MPAVNSATASMRRHAAWAVTLLLPALLFRALVPAGFMPMRDDQGRLSIMLCPGADPHAQHHHHHPGSPGGSDGDSGRHTLCPFAMSAGPALAYSVAVQASPSQQVDFASRREHVDPLIEPLKRAQSARAPPIPNQI